MFGLGGIEIFGFKLIHLWPFLLFGPFFLAFFYSMALRDIVNPTPAIRELQKRQKIERQRQKEERQRLAINEKARSKAAGENLTFRQYSIQALFFAPFAVVIGALSDSPSYTALKPDMSVLKLSMSIPGAHKEECHSRSKEELAKLSANKRVKKICPRERWPVGIDLKIDGEPFYREIASPAGLTSDSQSRIYKNFTISSGQHKLQMGISIGGDLERFDYVLEKVISLNPAEILVLTFDPSKKAIYTK